MAALRATREPSYLAEGCAVNALLYGCSLAVRKRCEPEGGVPLIGNLLGLHRLHGVQGKGPQQENRTF